MREDHRKAGRYHIGDGAEKERKHAEYDTSAEGCKGTHGGTL